MGIHDGLFKAVYSDPENAAAHFRAFLPPELRGALDLARAKLAPGSFVDETILGRHRSPVRSTLG